MKFQDFAKNLDKQTSKPKPAFSTDKEKREYDLMKSKNIHKSYANAMVSAFTIMGIMENPYICEKCKKRSQTVVAHHENYFSALDVQWLCGSCHQKRHSYLRRKGIDPSDVFYRKILESPSGDSYLIRLRQFYTQVAELSLVSLDADFLEKVRGFESRATVLISYKGEEDWIPIHNL